MQSESLHWEFAQPELRRLRLTVLLIGAAVASVVLSLLLIFGPARVQQVALLAGLPCVGLAVWLGWYIRASLQRYRFALLDDGLLLQSGVFWHSEVFVPRVRIQHTDVSQGPVARWLDLATLVLHTAGVKLVNLEIVGLRAARARELRDQLLIRQLRADTAAASTVEPALQQTP
jgi:membrane protein YdbS with pleckstrin-like domain